MTIDRIHSPEAGSLVVERTDKFRAVIESPGFGEFANGRELGVTGTVSAKYTEGTEEELGLAGVSVNGIAAALGEVDGNGNVVSGS